MAEPPEIIRPIPRRTFELTPASTESSVPPSPPLESTNPDLLDPRTDAGYSPSRTRSILNLTSSALLGIYSATGFEASREDTSTPWGTGAQTPSHRRDFDESGPASPSVSWDARGPKTTPEIPRSGIRGYYLPLAIRGIILFTMGIAYGAIITHLHDRRNLAPVKVEGINRDSWSYRAIWGLSGVAMGSLLPWIDLHWAENSEKKHSTSTNSRRQGRSVSMERANSGLASDWSRVVRSVGAFVGIAFAIVRFLLPYHTFLYSPVLQRKLPWQSTLQLSLTLALANPVLWYLIDKSKTGFLLSATVGIAGTVTLLSINPEMVPSPAAASPRATVTNTSMPESGGLPFITNESIGVCTWLASVLFCSCVCFGNIGRRLALGEPMQKRPT